MRHRKSNRRFDRPFNQRKALFKGLLNDLILHGQIRTTLAKAKAIRPQIERLVTLGRKGSQHHRRLAFARLGGKAPMDHAKDVQAKRPRVRRNTVEKLFDEIAPRYETEGRPGGYTRIIKLPRRKTDGAEMAVIQFV